MAIDDRDSWKQGGAVASCVQDVRDKPSKANPLRPNTRPRVAPSHP